MHSTSKWFVISVLMFGIFYSTQTDANAATTLRASAMASASTQKGARYVYGAEGGYSKGYDCSGLIKWAYKQHGKTLARTAQGQYNNSKKVASKDRKPGDLIFILDSSGHVYHVGIYIGIKNGKGYMLNANSGSYRGKKVLEAPISEYTAGPSMGRIGRY